MNVGVCVKAPKNIVRAERNCVWNSATCSYKNGKYVGSILTIQ